MNRQAMLDVRHNPCGRSVSSACRLEHLLNQAPVVIYSRAADSRFGMTFVSNTLRELLGYEPEDFLAHADFWYSRLHPDDLAQVVAGLRQVLAGEPMLCKYRFRLNNGEWKWLRDRAKAITDPVGNTVEIVGAWTDLSELIRIEDALRKSEEKHRFLLEQINAGVLVYTPDSRVVYSNKHASTLLGFSPEQLQGADDRCFDGLFMREDESYLPGAQLPVHQVIRSGQALENRVLGINRRDLDDKLWVIANAFPEWDDSGELRHVVVTLLDITERVKSQEKIYRLAHYDTLTELPNRSLIHERIAQAIHLSHREQRSFALLFLDLDDFKKVNDSLGHYCGDQLLRQVAARLRHSVREGDTVGRLGGDEFVVLLLNTGDSGAAAVADKLIDALKRPFDVDGQLLSTQASIGISIYPNDGLESDLLTRHADIAMYHAKEAGGGGYYFFDSDMNVRIENRHALERDMRLALEQRQFLLHYQPQIDLSSGACVGLEALIRWRHPQRGTISPCEFIPVAEESGLIRAIGVWVLQQVGRDIEAFKAAGLPKVRVAVNVSQRQLQSPQLAEQLLDVITDTGIPSDCLELELTETLMMENHAVVLDFMRQCRNKGIHFAIDDFGTGYSSLSYLNKLPLDKLKIDRAFIKEIAQSGDANTIVSTIVSMAKSLRLKVVAEGVETEQQLRYLKECGCNAVQGFYFSPPVPYEKVIDWLRPAAST